MLVRSREPLAVAPGTYDAWDLVLQSQTQCPVAGWLIPQPAHSAVSGEIAAALSPEHFPGLSAQVRQCIALHDTGWSPSDAQQIAAVNEPGFAPTPFISEPPRVFVPAWKASIDAVERICPEGGYMVSRHFDSLGKEPNTPYSKPEQQQIEQFHQKETARQQRLEEASGNAHAELEALLEANRFCDLLSLFLCANLPTTGGLTVQFAQRVEATKPPYEMRWTGNAWSFGGDTPFTRRAEITFSGVSFGGPKGGGWFHAAIE